jgi:hypothetical protein
MSLQILNEDGPPVSLDDDVIDVGLRVSFHLNPKALRINLWKVAPAFFKPKGSRRSSTPRKV